jgi:hypothetical protein
MFAVLRRTTPLIGLLLLLIVGIGAIGRSCARFHRSFQSIAGAPSAVGPAARHPDPRTAERAGPFHREQPT